MSHMVKPNREVAPRAGGPNFNAVRIKNQTGRRRTQI